MKRPCPVSLEQQRLVNTACSCVCTFHHLAPLATVVVGEIVNAKKMGLVVLLRRGEGLLVSFIQYVDWLAWTISLGAAGCRHCARDTHEVVMVPPNNDVLSTGS